MSDVAATLGHGVDQPFLAKHANGTPDRRTRNVELLDQLALGGYARIRLVLAGLDP